MLNWKFSHKVLVRGPGSDCTSPSNASWGKAKLRSGQLAGEVPRRISIGAMSEKFGAGEDQECYWHPEMFDRTMVCLHKHWLIAEFSSFSLNSPDLTRMEIPKRHFTRQLPRTPFGFAPRVT